MAVRVHRRVDSVSDGRRRCASGSYAHLLYFHMLNIDADPRLQGFASHQADVVVGTNVLHATPNIRKTVTHCRQLLADGGFILINEMFRPTASVVQITFGMTDGWWLFAEVGDTERTGQDSPLLSWRQWEALLLEVGWERVMPVTVNAAAVGGPKDLSMSQAIIVAQASGSGQYDIADIVYGGTQAGPARHVSGSVWVALGFLSLAGCSTRAPQRSWSILERLRPTDRTEWTGAS